MTLNQIDADLIEPQRLAECVIDQLKIERCTLPPDQPRGITAREALIALRYDAQLVALSASNLSHGVALTDYDLACLLVAWGHIEAVMEGAGL